MKPKKFLYDLIKEISKKIKNSKASNIKTLELNNLASTRGVEPPAPRLGGVCSILLSYVDL